MKAQFLLPFALLLVLFSACQKEETNATLSTPAEISPEVYLNALQESVLFQYDLQDLTTGQHTGWFIGKNGEVRAYTMEAEDGDRISGSECSATDLGQMRNAAEGSLMNIQAEELARYFRMTRRVNNSQLSERVDDDSRNEVITLTTFRAIQTTYESDGDCSGELPHLVSDEDRLFQIVALKLDGAISQLNESEDAQQLVEWLEGLQERMEL